MKIKYCAACWGTGKVPDFWDNDKEVICPHCNGTGKEPPMTNEDWFVDLSTEEKAEWLTDFVSKQNKNRLEWYWWLKQPHREEAEK